MDSECSMVRNGFGFSIPSAKELRVPPIVARMFSCPPRKPSSKGDAFKVQNVQGANASGLAFEHCASR